MKKRQPAPKKADLRLLLWAMYSDCAGLKKYEKFCKLLDKAWRELDNVK